MGRGGHPRGGMPFHGFSGVSGVDEGGVGCSREGEPEGVDRRAGDGG